MTSQLKPSKCQERHQVANLQTVCGRIEPAINRSDRQNPDGFSTPRSHSIARQALTPATVQ